MISFDRTIYILICIGICGESGEDGGRLRRDEGHQHRGGQGGRERRGHVRPVQSGPVATHLGRALQGHRLVRRGHPGARRAQSGRHALQTSRAVHQEGEEPQAHHIRAQQVRSRAHLDHGWSIRCRFILKPLSSLCNLRSTQTAKVGGDFVAGASDTRLPRQPDQPVRQGRSHPAAAPVRQAAQGQEADQRGLHRLPEHGQEFGDQRSAQEEGVQCGAHSRRDQGVAVRDAHEAHLSHRLSRRGLSARRLGERHRAQGRRARREHTMPRGPCRRGAQARQEGAHSAHLQAFRVDRSHRLSREARRQDRQAQQGSFLESNQFF